MGLDVTGYCADNTYIDTQHEPENEMTKIYQITANGVDFGQYVADSVEHARDLYAQDAGYTDYALLCTFLREGMGEEPADIVTEVSE
jgi:hypothetical protein